MIIHETVDNPVEYKTREEFELQDCSQQFFHRRLSSYLRTASMDYYSNIIAQLYQFLSLVLTIIVSVIC